MATQITLPHLGENIESGDVLSLLVSEGDTIAVDQEIVEIETDKATIPVPSPTAGKVLKILVNEGDTLNIGAPILEIEAAAEAPNAAAPSPGEPASAGGEPEPTPAPPSEPAPPAPQPTPVPAAVAPASPAPPVAEAPSPVPLVESSPVDVPGDGHSSAAAGPSVRRLARELGVELRRVRPSGSDGRITEDDVRAHVRAGNAQADSAVTQGVTPPGTPASDGQGAVHREKMSRMRQTIARNMLQSYSTIPQLTNFDDVDITALERIRKDSKDDYAATGIKLTSMPFLIKSIASALKQHPILNASLSTNGDQPANEIIYKEYVNIGIAVDTERGLVVPVLRDADRKNIPQIARELAALAELVRTGTFKVEDIRGGTFTISNLGAIGGTYSTPIINPPEVAILLVGRSRMLPQFIDGEFQPRLMMPLSLTYDHRIVDGAAAARFLNEVKGYLANPGRLLLAP